MSRLAAGLLIAVLAAAAVPAVAQEEPPARVGRLSFVEGQVAFHTTGETSWSAATVNYPVATGGSFWVDPKSRAEMRIGAQTINLAGDTEIDVVRLDQQVMQLAVPQGRIELRLRSLTEGNTVEIDIPRGGTWLLQPGTYDIDAGSADRPARIMVFDGSAHFSGAGVDIAIKAGDAAVISGTDTLTATLERAAPDAFVEWCRSRDYREDRLTAPKYVSPRMTGYEELDQYGSWASTPDYGQVWYPSSVPADWAPYRDGHWAWVPPWGWTWVDAEPWGFAPFHYGRWARLDGRWCWVPGRMVEHPVYAPALVAFVGGIAAAQARGPSVGWFPLAPGEVYWPSYTRNPGYIRNVNITNVNEARINTLTAAANRPQAGPPPQVVSQNFANRTAATVVPTRAFASAARVAPAALNVPPQALQRAGVSVRPPQVTPPPAGPAAAVLPGRAPPGAAAGGPPGRPAATATAVPPPVGPGGVGTAEPPPIRPHRGGPPGTPPGSANTGAVAGPPLIHPPGGPAATGPGGPPAGRLPGAAATGPGIPPVGRPPSAAATTAPAGPPAMRPTPPAAAGTAAPAGAPHGPPAAHLPPPAVPPAPAVAVRPPPPSAVHPPPPSERAAPSAVAPPPAAHAAPPAHAPPPSPVSPPPAAMHAPPPPAAMHPPAPPAPHAPPVAAPQPPPAVMHAPAAPVPRAPPAAAPQPPPAAHAPPPQPAPAAAQHPAALQQHGGQPSKKDDKKDDK